MEKLLTINDLKVSFSLPEQKITAVDGVNLEINPGQTVVLAGESGSGKTVTALSITRILPRNALIESGRIRFCGSELSREKEADLIKIRGARIAYIFQEPTSHLNPVLNIGDQITEGIILHQLKSRKAAYRQAQGLLSLLQFSDPERVLQSYPHQLSGGMNQRALLAMALVCKPELLIADEPTTALDVTVEAQTLKLLMQVKKELGFALLFITHNLSIARRIAEKIYVMYQGKIVEEGDCEKIFSSPQHPHTHELVNAYERIATI